MNPSWAIFLHSKNSTRVPKRVPGRAPKPRFAAKQTRSARKNAEEAGGFIPMSKNNSDMMNTLIFLTNALVWIIAISLRIAFFWLLVFIFLGLSGQLQTKSGRGGPSELSDGVSGE